MVLIQKEPPCRSDIDHRQKKITCRIYMPLKLKEPPTRREPSMLTEVTWPLEERNPDRSHMPLV